MKTASANLPVSQLPEGRGALQDTVIGGGYCVGCGVCATVPGSPLEIRLGGMGWYEPVYSSAPTTNASVPVDSVCPFSATSKNEDELSDELFDSLPSTDGRIGRYSELYAGHVAEGGFRGRGSSGGMASWLLEKLLVENHIDAALHVRPAPGNAEGPLFTYQVSKTVSEICEGAKSRYYPVEMSQVLRFARENPGRYAIVGVPCFIKAVRLVMRQDPVLAERIRYCLAILCGHMKSTHFATLLGWQAGFQPTSLKKIDFRMKLMDRPANQYGVELQGKGQESKVLPMTELLGNDWGMGLMKLNACDYCDDVAGETADICVGDAWLPRYVKDPKGSNIIIVRNSTLGDLLKKGIRDGALELQAVPATDVVASQRASFTHRRVGLAYRLFLADRKKIWRPRKRISANPLLFSPALKRVQRARLKLSQLSHEIFAEALRREDLQYFREKLAPLVHQYHHSRLGAVQRIRLYLKKVAKRVWS